MSVPLLMGADLRYSEHERLKDLAAPVAVSLKESGWTNQRIADEIGTSPMTVGMWLPPHLAHAPTQAQLRKKQLHVPKAKPVMRSERRGAEAFLRKRADEEFRAIRKGLRKRYQLEASARREMGREAARRIRARRVAERRTERAAWREYFLRERAGLRAQRREEREYDRWLVKQLRIEEMAVREEQKAARRGEELAGRRERKNRKRLRRAFTRELKVVSFDGPPEGNFALSERIADPRELDPLQILIGASERHLDEIVGDLRIEDLSRMDESTLEAYRERILEAGLAPSSVQRSERERLQHPARHRGGAPPPMKSHMSTQHKHRKPGHRSSAGGQRSARKPKPHWTREAA